MIKVSAFYPNTPGKRFDMSYYLTSHVPMAKQKFGAALKRLDVDEGVAGVPEGPAKFIASVHMYFDSAEAFGQAFGPHVEAIMADVPNYTDIEPIIQINAIKL